MIMKKILILEDDTDTAIGTIITLRNRYQLIYVSNIIDFNEIVLDDLNSADEEKYYCYIMDLQLDTEFFIPDFCQKVIPKLYTKNINNLSNINSMHLLGLDYFEYIMREDHFESIRKKLYYFQDIIIY